MQRLSVTYASAAVLGGVLRVVSAPGTAQGAVSLTCFACTPFVRRSFRGWSACYNFKNSTLESTLV